VVTGKIVPSNFRSKTTAISGRHLGMKWTGKVSAIDASDEKHDFVFCLLGSLRKPFNMGSTGNLANGR